MIKFRFDKSDFVLFRLRILDSSESVYRGALCLYVFELRILFWSFEIVYLDG